MSKESRDRDYLEHALDAIGRVARYVEGNSESQFRQNGMLQDAVIRIVISRSLEKQPVD